MSFPPPTPRQARVIWFTLTALMLGTIIGGLALALGWLVKKLSAVLLPVALALILAYILDPLVELFVRKKIPRIWSILLVYLACLLVCAGLMWSVVPDLIAESQKLVQVLNAKDIHTQVKDFLKNSPMLKQISSSLSRSPTNSLQSPAESARNPSPKNTTSHASSTNVAVGTNAIAATNTNSVVVSLNIQTSGKTNVDGTVETNKMEFSADIAKLQKDMGAPFSETIVPALAQAMGSFFSWMSEQLGKVTTWVEFLVGFVLVPVYLFYFLLEKHGINKHWTDYLPITESKAKQELIFVLNAINECMVVFFRGQVLVALCVGVLLTVSYLILGLNYAVLLGVIAGTLGIIPYLGTITSLIIALTVAAVQFGDWAHPLGVLGIAAAVKLLEDFLISPKIIGERSGLHPLTIILAVMIGAKLMGGFLGALLAVPLTAVLRTLMFRYVWKKRPHKSKVAEPKEAADLAS